MSVGIPRYTPPVDAQGLMAREWQVFFQDLAASAALTRGIEVVIAGEGMPIQAKQLVPPTQVSDTLTEYYRADARGRAVVTLATVSNPTGADQTLTVHIVPSGGTPNGTNIVLPALNVPAGDVLVLEELRHAIDSGASIWAVSSAASQLILTISGAVFFA